MSDTVYVGITGKNIRGGLSPIVQGSIETAHTIAIKQGDGSAYDLTGASLSGIWWLHSSPGMVYAVTGPLTVTDAENGVFTWDKSEDDIGTPGVLKVQFIITAADGDTDATFPAAMTVENRGEANNVVPGDVLDGGTPGTVFLTEVDGGEP